jgi:hypothetical protein
LTEEQQVVSFINSNNKFQSLFSNKSQIFIPPFGSFNSATLKAMAESGLEMLSTSYQEENSVASQNKMLITTENSKIYQSKVNTNGSASAQARIKTVYHIPFDISLLDLLQRGYSGENLTQTVLHKVKNDIDRYGFSLITLHPTDFGTIDATTKKHVNSVDPFKFQVLVNIIDALEAQRVKITDFSYITPLPPPLQ